MDIDNCAIKSMVSEYASYLDDPYDFYSGFIEYCWAGTNIGLRLYMAKFYDSDKGGMVDSIPYLAQLDRSKVLRLCSILSSELSELAGLFGDVEFLNGIIRWRLDNGR